MSKIRLAVTTTKRTIVTLLVGLSLFAVSSTNAAVINLNFNSLPSAQGWTFFTSTDTNEVDVFSVNGTALHQNSLGIVDDPKYVWQGVVERMPFDLQFRARLTEFEGPEPGAFAFSVLLGAGDFFVYIGLGPGFVEIEENITTVQRVFIDTSQFHDYRLLGDPEAGSYRLFIDGNEVLSQIIGHIPLDSHFLMIGDRVFGSGPSIAPVGAKADLSLFVFDYVNVAKQVAIDIKPGSFRNRIELEDACEDDDSRLPVAILTTPDFDALAVAPSTVELGDPGLSVTATPIRSRARDVDGDGDVDLRLVFSLCDLVTNGALAASSTELVLTGETLTGSPISGSDSVRVVQDDD